MYLSVMGAIRTNTQYNQIRTNLEARSLYNPDRPYTINNNSVIKAINSIAGLIPGKSIDITNSPYGRLLGLGVQTPIVTIGSKMYAKHIAQSVTSFGISDVLPSVNLRNLFDGDPTTKLLTKKVDYRITRDETKSTIGRLIQDITNQSPKLSNTVFTGRGNLAPFDKFPNQFDYIRNTGKGQLNQYYANLGRNLYVQTSADFIQVASDQGYKINKVTKALLNKPFFPTNDYANFPDGQAASDEYRFQLVNFRESNNEERISEYGSEITTLGLGKSKKNARQELAQNLPNQEQDLDVDFAEGEFGFNENISDQIVWGRDTDINNFGVRSGALSYTKSLLQARGSKGFFDQTKKKHFDPKTGQYIYNGSPLTRDLEGNINRSRQSIITDPYNNYAKAIRFQGNEIYNAPVESVINKTVIPKFHPIIDTSNRVNNKNMMFSIENLAYILNDNGYLGDTLGTKVPKSEVGYNRGRLMWFAPYDVEVNETAAAKYESTQFIGRSEPIYSYQSSERSARLSFKLIVDYPPQVDGLSQGENSKFFAFGGRFNEKAKNIDIDKLTANVKTLEDELEGLQPTVKLLTPVLDSGEKSIFYFPNDVRDIQESLNLLYEDGIKQEKESSDDSLNTKFTASITNAVQLLTQPIGESFGYNFYKLEFVGRASKLYSNQSKEQAYNTELGKDRATSLNLYLEKSFKEQVGKSFSAVGLQTTISTLGSAGGSTTGATVAGISEKVVKQERSAWVNFIPNGVEQRKTVGLTPDQEKRKKIVIAEIQANKDLINSASKVQSDERLFNEVKIRDRALRGFESMKKITFSPVFHSQTPEDFHRRLTFLHQCTRQGNSVINNDTAKAGISSPTNSVFGRPPICVLRLGDMFHSKVIIETVDFDYGEAIWDINPEGMGMQYMIADITISMKLIGGQSLKGAIDVIQNAESFNYYANSTFYKNDVYKFARKVEDAQVRGDETLINAKGFNRFGEQIESNDPNDFNPLPPTPAV